MPFEHMTCSVPSASPVILSAKEGIIRQSLRQSGLWYMRPK